MQEKTRGVGILTTLEGSAIPVRRAARPSIVTVLREQVPGAISRRKRAD
jgi:hypothetical protein